MFSPASWVFGPKKKYSLSPAHWLRSLLEGFGLGWLIVEPTSFFVPEFETWVKAHHLIVFEVIIVGSLLFAFFASIKQLSRTAKIRDTDVVIEVLVGDIFKYSPETVIVITTTTTFDTCMEDDFISAASLQGQLCKKWYGGSWRDMEAVVGPQVDRLTPDATLEDGRKSKTKRYPLGSTVQITKDGAHAYLLGLTSMNPNGRAHAVFDDVQRALVGLWTFVAEHGESMDVTVPLLGMGASRVSATKTDVIESIAQSFIAACTQGTKRFCDHLRIVISVSDFRKGGIDLDEIAETLRCFGRVRRSSLTQQSGTEVPQDA